MKILGFPSFESLIDKARYRRRRCWRTRHRHCRWDRD
jgi:hypothetical protein